MSPNEYTEQELSTLTPDERSALEAESATDDDAEVLKAIAGEEAAIDDAAAESVATTVAETTTKAIEEVNPAEAEAATIDADKTFHAEAPADAKEQRTALRAEKAAAFKQLMDGEIDAEAYAAIEDKVADGLEALVRSEVTADVSTKIAAQAKSNEWSRALNEAVAKAKADGLDYLGDKAMTADFDSLLKLYSGQAAQQGMSDDNLEASKWALAQAGAMMRKMNGAITKPVSATKDPATPAAARHNLTTLAGLPAADRAPIADDVMAKIGSLQGEDLEKYMATLSSKEVERIMASA